VKINSSSSKRFRYLATIQKGKITPNGNSCFSGAEMVPYLTMEYLRGEIAEPPLIPINAGALVASHGDLLLLWDGSNAGEFLRAKPGVVSSTTALVKPRGIDREYFFSGHVRL
jgi:type I restriction enzyme S subunit